MFKRIDRIITVLENIFAGLQKMAQLLQQFYEHVQRQPPPHEDGELEVYLEKEEVMAYLDIKHSTYYRWLENGKLVPRSTIGRDKYYKRDIEALMAHRKYRKRG